jgi:hypothetical protein
VNWTGSKLISNILGGNRLPAARIQKQNNIIDVTFLSTRQVRSRTFKLVILSIRRVGLASKYFSYYNFKWKLIWNFNVLTTNDRTLKFCTITLTNMRITCIQFHVE